MPTKVIIQRRIQAFTAYDFAFAGLLPFHQLFLIGIPLPLYDGGNDSVVDSAHHYLRKKEVGSLLFPRLYLQLLFVPLSHVDPSLRHSHFEQQSLAYKKVNFFSLKGLYHVRLSYCSEKQNPLLLAQS